MNIFFKWLDLHMTVFKSSSFSILNNAHQLLSNIIRATLFPRLKWTFINIKIKNYEMLIDQADVVLCLLWIFFHSNQDITKMYHCWWLVNVIKEFERCPLYAVYFRGLFPTKCSVPCSQLCINRWRNGCL